MIFCVDLENVHTTGLAGVEYLDENDAFMVFYSVSTPYIEQSLMDNILKSGCRFDAYKLVTSGKNALDFYICAKVGEIVANCPDQEIAIIAKDKGYTALIDYVESYGKNGCQVFMAENVRSAMIASKELNSRKAKIHEGLTKVSIESTYNKVLRERELAAIKIEADNEHAKATTQAEEAKQIKVLHKAGVRSEDVAKPDIVYILPKKTTLKKQSMKVVRFIGRRFHNILRKVA